MILKKIKLNNFRNYQSLNWEPKAGVNFITGFNAQGKTNLLEAVFLSGMGYSFRKKTSDVIKWGYDTAVVESNFAYDSTITEISVVIDRTNSKKLLIDGVSEKQKFMPGRFGIVLFKPDDLQIVNGPPLFKRNFIDYDIGHFNPIHIGNLTRYRRIVEQRNNLLRTGEINNDSFHTWNESFYKYGALILAERIKILKKFIPLVKKSYAAIAGEDEELQMKYLSTLKINNQINQEHLIKELFHEFIAEGKTRQKEELYKKQTVFGPHRDELVFFINNQDARHYASQGQIRSIVLALKTAQINLFYLENGAYPLFLLDDVLMELDEKRQQYLLNLINSGYLQSFITTTALIDKKNIHADGVYLINKGTLKEVSV